MKRNILLRNIAKGQSMLKRFLMTGIIFYGIIMILGYKEMAVSLSYNGGAKSYTDLFFANKAQLPYIQQLIGSSAVMISAMFEAILLFFIFQMLQAKRFFEMMIMLQKISYTFFALVVWRIMQEPFYSLLSTIHLSKGERVMSLMIDSEHLKLLLISGCLMLLAQYMRRAYEMEKEAELTV